jgi:hypothetical protein
MDWNQLFEFKLTTKEWVNRKGSGIFSSSAKSPDLSGTSLWLGAAHHLPRQIDHKF